MTMMTMASRRGDLNLNFTPMPGYEDHVKEGLKQAMIQHEIVFKHQVSELHRLYWTQKSLMNEVFWRQSDWLSTSDVQKQCKASIEEMKARDMSAVNSMEIQSTSLKLHENGRRHMEVDFSAIEAKANGTYGFKPLVDNDVNTSHSQVTVSSDFCLETRMSNESSQRSREKCSEMELLIERWHKQNFIQSDVGLREDGVCLSANASSEKQKPNYKHVYIDLNIAQNDETINDFPNTEETSASPSTSSSIIPHGVNLRVSSIKYPKESESRNRSANESIIMVGHGVVSPDSENSRGKSADSLLHEPKDSYPSLVQTSAQSSVIENYRNYNVYIVDSKVGRSGTRCPEQCSKSLAKRFSNANNCGTQNITDETVPVELFKPGKGNIYSSFDQPNISVPGESRNNVSISSSCLEHCCLHAAAGSTNLPTKITEGLKKKEKHKEGSEEDTSSSHATVQLEKQHDEPRESPAGTKFNKLTRDSKCTSENKCEKEHLVVSNSENSVTTQLDLVMPENNSCKQVPDVEYSGFICIDDKPCYDHASQPEEELVQKFDQIVEMDHIIAKAAETLVLFSLSPMDHLTSDQRDNPEFEEGHGHPQSSDSYETITLKLQEITDDGNSICVKQIDNENRKDGSGFRLRRGARDFQKDILPGIISLSRHEICEDLYAIKYELRKNKSCRTNEENCGVPGRSRRSRLRTLHK
ncbi:hypothetical protein Cni_G08935 [Canna indica]|uniref:Uncharacterized protein n=1 Tax=Canna indica TaxID=4628 RepID=A0AAQ3K1R8_9LILI|nr:hypothetical protein Cni_G08935 [Canna indica]